MNGKCPRCEMILDRVVLEAIIIQPGHGFSAPAYNGVSYLCPHCHSILSVSIDPVALKTDIFSEIASRVRTG